MTKIYLLWEGATAPDGWDIDTSHDDRLLRGGSTYVDGAGHTHLVSYAESSSKWTPKKWGPDNTYIPIPTHSHAAANTSIESSFPPYRSIRLITSDMPCDGLCGVLPAGIIGFCNALPDGWTEQTAFNSKFILLKNQTPANGGSASHTHTPPSNTPAGSGGVHVLIKTAATHYIPESHTHPITGSISAATAEPDWFGMKVCKLDSIDYVPTGLIAMFDGLPPDGWQVIAGLDAYIKQAAYGTLGGNSSHTHAHNLATTATSQPTGRIDQHAIFGTPTDTSTNSHTHAIGALASKDYDPAFAQFIFAKWTGSDVQLCAEIERTAEVKAEEDGEAIVLAEITRTPNVVADITDHKKTIALQLTRTADVNVTRFESVAATITRTANVVTDESGNAEIFATITRTANVDAIAQGVDIAATITRTPKVLAGEVPSCEMSVDPEWITEGEDAVLTWVSGNCNTVVIDQGIGSVATNGNTTVSPAITTTYRGTFTGDGGTCYCYCTLVVHPEPPPATKHIYLLWEGATPPDGWEIDTSHDDRLLRGGSTYGNYDGGHKHAVSYEGGGSSSLIMEWHGWCSTDFTKGSHGHASSDTGIETGFPPYRSLRLIKSTMTYGTLPAGIVAFTKYVLDGWTEQTDYNSKFIYLKDQTPANGGSASHTHTPPAYTGYQDSGTIDDDGCPFSDASDKFHRHPVTGVIYGDTSNAEPDWYGMRVCKLDAEQTTPRGMVAMFDEVPSLISGWKVISISEKYIKQAAYGTLGGNSSHTHAHNLATTATDCNDCGWFEQTDGNACPCSHTHTVTPLMSEDDYTPPCVQFIFCEFVGAEILIQPIHGTKTYGSPLRSDDIAIGDTVRVYNTSGGKVAMKETWNIGQQITLRLGEQ